MANSLFGGNSYTQFTPVPSTRTRAFPPATYSAVTNPMPAVQTPQTNIIWVNSIEDVYNYPMRIGWQYWFADRNRDVIYTREIDINGVASPIKVLPYSVEDASPIPQPSTQIPEQKPIGQTQVQNSENNYVTRDEFDSISSKLTSKLEEIGNQLTELLS